MIHIKGNLQIPTLWYESFASSIPQHVSPIFSWVYMQIGGALRRGPRVRIEEISDPQKGPYSITVFDDDVLVRANLINNSMDTGRIRKEMGKGLGLWPELQRSFLI